LHKKRLK